MYSFPQIILNEAGNSYLGDASKYLSHASLQAQLKDILKGRASNKNKYFVFEMSGKEAILRAAQPKAMKVIEYFNKGNNSKRVIVHFDQFFLPYPKPKDKPFDINEDTARYAAHC